MLIRTILLALALGATAAGAQAAITTGGFTGTGKVTYEYRFPGVDRGDPVTVSGSFNLGDGSRPDLAPIIPDDYTGTVEMSYNALNSGYQSFSYSISGVGSGAGRYYEESSATLVFVRGTLRSFSMSVLDYYSSGISENSFWAADYWGDEYASGVWKYTGATGVIPEPGTWALMIGGFGVTGAALRRRRAVAA